MFVKQIFEDFEHLENRKESNLNRATGVLDQTGVVAGYLKSIEQLLYAVIRLSINDNRLIRLKNGELGEFNNDNEEYVDTTLGSLTHYIKHNGDILDVNNYVKRYLVDTLFTWIDEERNGHFHKDNIHDPDKVDEIRKQTLLLYYLILGAFKINESDRGKLGIVDVTGDTVDEETLYQQFRDWASPVILYDIPSTAGAVGFMLTAFVGRPWDIALQAMRESTETDYRWNRSQLFSTSYLSNNFCWENHLDWKDGLNQVIRIVERYMSEDLLAAEKLRSFPKVIIGGFEVYKIFTNESC